MEVRKKVLITLLVFLLVCVSAFIFLLKVNFKLTNPFSPKELLFQTTENSLIPLKFGYSNLGDYEKTDSNTFFITGYFHGIVTEDKYIYAKMSVQKDSPDFLLYVGNKEGLVSYARSFEVTGNQIIFSPITSQRQIIKESEFLEQIANSKYISFELLKNEITDLSHIKCTNTDCENYLNPIINNLEETSKYFKNLESGYPIPKNTKLYFFTQAIHG